MSSLVEHPPWSGRYIVRVDALGILDPARPSNVAYVPPRAWLDAGYALLGWNAIAFRHPDCASYEPG